MNWIEVTKIKPELYETVIIYDENTGVDLGYVDKFDWNFATYGNGVTPKNVTHWMPLPKKPNEK